MLISKAVSFIRRSLQINATRVYRSSKELVESGESAITLSPDGAVVVCWHPVRKVPYECTKPISHDIKSLRTPTSPLKINVSDTIIKNSAEPTVVELSKAFGVPWFHFRPKRSQKSRSPYFWAPPKERNSL
ncbi:putative mitochondrial 28S ribosomal protein S32 (S32mt) (MRP-S32) [Schistosoma mansoni]|uniref:Putative mitochondrial 28S ribosomal protein S32 (S32mt) (MRP-S32) n=1 Tax=Schistosoma mansoni TaxID=6183 RepID=G4VII4_SCHMA|nr:putative mitochondrial 28S ribosomal protein S32 (S32mt) (MRP-S32) [Schistosoma mansoni]|eukprot:XP_018651840.1 putative mitochondrial 28S ribosomal protein S32 (S32mt) (MRP-S32) [Schistosoma mansoni]